MDANDDRRADRDEVNPSGWCCHWLACRGIGVPTTVGTRTRAELYRACVGRLGGGWPGESDTVEQGRPT